MPNLSSLLLGIFMCIVWEASWNADRSTIMVEAFAGIGYQASSLNQTYQCVPAHPTKLVWTIGVNVFTVTGVAFAAGVTGNLGSPSMTPPAEIVFQTTANPNNPVGQFSGQITQCFPTYLQPLTFSTGHILVLEMSCIDDESNQPRCMQYTPDTAADELLQLVSGAMGDTFEPSWNHRLGNTSVWNCTMNPQTSVVAGFVRNGTTGQHVGSFSLTSVPVTKQLTHVTCAHNVDVVDAWFYLTSLGNFVNPPASSSSSGRRSSSSSTGSADTGSSPCCIYFSPFPVTFAVGNLGYVSILWLNKKGSNSVCSIDGGTPLPGGLTLTGCLIAGTPLLSSVGSYAITVHVSDRGTFSAVLQFDVTFGSQTSLAVAWSPNPASMVVGQYGAVNASWSVARTATSQCVMNGQNTSALINAGLQLTTLGLHAGDVHGTPTAYRAPLFLVMVCRTDSVTATTLTTNLTIIISATAPTGTIANFSYDPGVFNLTACQSFIFTPTFDYDGNRTLQFAISQGNAQFLSIAANNVNINSNTGVISGGFFADVMRNLVQAFPDGVAVTVSAYEIVVNDGGGSSFTNNLLGSTVIVVLFNSVAFNETTCELPDLSLAKCTPGSVTTRGMVDVTCTGQMFMTQAQIYITDLSVPQDLVTLSSPVVIESIQGADVIAHLSDCDTSVTFLAPNATKGGQVRLTIVNPPASSGDNTGSRGSNVQTNNPTAGHVASSTIIFLYCFNGLQCYCGNLGLVYIPQVDSNGNLIDGPSCDCDVCPAGTCVPAACEACPTGAYCINGFMYPLPGYWSYDSRSPPGACTVPAACPGAVDDNGVFREADANGEVNTQLCNDPYAGDFCSSCIDDYTKDGDICRKCPDGTSTYVLGFIFLMGMLFMAGCFAFLSDENLFRAVLMLLSLQQLVVIGRTAAENLSGTGSDEVARFFNTLGIFNFQIDFVSPDCSVGNLHFYAIFFATLVLVGIAFVLLMIAALVRSLLLFKFKLMTDKQGRNVVEMDEYYRGGEDTEGGGRISNVSAVRNKGVSLSKAALQDESVDWIKYFKRRSVHSTIILLTMAYLQIATRVFQALDCTSVDGEMHLVAELSSICYQGGNLASGITAWVLLFVYLIGFPVWAFYIVKRSFHKGAYDLKRAEKYGYLYRNLKDYAYWFRTLSYLTSFAIALQSVLADNAALRLFLVAIFLIFNAIMVSLIWPFLTEFANYVPVIVGFVIPVITAFFIASQPQGKYRWKLFGALVGVIVLAYILIFIASKKRTKTVAWLTRVSGAAEMPRTSSVNAAKQSNAGIAPLPSAPTASNMEEEESSGEESPKHRNNQSRQVLQTGSTSSRPSSPR